MSDASLSDSKKSTNGRAGLSGGKRVQTQRQSGGAAETEEAGKSGGSVAADLPKDLGGYKLPESSAAQPQMEQPGGKAAEEAQGIQTLLQQTGGGHPSREDFEDTRSEVAAEVGLVFHGGTFAKELSDMRVRPYRGEFVKEGAFAKDIVEVVFERFWGLELAGLTLSQRLLDDSERKTLAKMNLYLWCYLHASNEAESGIGGGGVIDTGGRMDLAGVSVTGETISKAVFSPAYSVHRFTRTQCEEVADAISHILTLSSHRVPGYGKLETLIRSRAADYKLGHLPQYAFVGADSIGGLKPQVLDMIKDAQSAYVAKRNAQAQDRANQKATGKD